MFLKDGEQLTELHHLVYAEDRPLKNAGNLRVEGLCRKSGAGPRKDQAAVRRSCGEQDKLLRE